jgi:hypothetical protein
MLPERRDSLAASPRWSLPLPPHSPPPEQPERFATAFGPLYRNSVGRPRAAHPPMVGLHLIKHMDGLSDEAVCARFPDSPYVQLFCGESRVQYALPLDRSSMTRWRQRISAERLALLLAETRATAQRTHVNRGDRGHDAQQSSVFLSGQRRDVTPTIRREIRRHAGIEPVIGHMKADGHLCRNFLAAAGHTLRLLRA